MLRDATVMTWLPPLFYTHLVNFPMEVILCSVHECVPMKQVDLDLLCSNHSNTASTASLESKAYQSTHTYDTSYKLKILLMNTHSLISRSYSHTKENTKIKGKFQERRNTETLQCNRSS